MARASLRTENEQLRKLLAEQIAENAELRRRAALYTNTHSGLAEAAKRYCATHHVRSVSKTDLEAFIHAH